MRNLIFRPADAVAASCRVSRWCAVVAATFLTAAAAAQDIQWSNPDASRDAPAEQRNLTPFEAAQQLQQLVGREAQRRVIVQFDSPMTPDSRQRLAESGVTILSSLGSNAYFATVDSRSLDMQRAAGVASLQNVAPIERNMKLHQLVQPETMPDYAVVGTVDRQDGSREKEPKVAVGVLFHRDVLPEEALRLADAHRADVITELKTINGLMLELPASEVLALADRDAVQWIEPPLPPLSETNAENRVATQADIAQESPYNLDGTGVSVMVFDGGTALASHNDFSGRLTIEDGDSLSDHATHVAGTIGGDGSDSLGFEHRGMAPNVQLRSYGFQWGGGGTFLYSNPGDIEADYGHAIANHNIDLANNSIGTNTAPNGFPCEITGEYGLTSSIIDAIVRGDLGSPVRVVWANGNERQTSRCGEFYNTTAPPSCAKNHLTVGALNSNDDSVTGFTSWGPAKDGRLKPDIAAPGCESGDGVTSTSSNGGYSTKCGTSMAAPTVTGLGALLLQDYRDQFLGQDDFSPAMMKAMFIHAAKDVQNPGPDYQTGYGVTQVVDTIDFMRTGSFVESSVAHGGTQSFIITVDQPGELRVTVAWDDVPGTPNVIPSLVNDLDVIVTGPDGTFYPWTLDPNNPGAPAVRNQPDHLNNIEQVVVDNASAGIWTVQVSGYDVPEGPQDFALAASPNVVNTGIDFPDGLPTLVLPSENVPVSVQIRAFGEEVIDGSETMFSRVGTSGSFTESPLNHLGGDLYEAILPGAACESVIQYYFAAESTISGDVYSPSSAPSDVHETEIGEIVEMFADDFDSDTGWVAGAPGDDAISGLWERVSPNGSSVGNVPVQPSDAYVGSQCFVTGQHPGGGAGENDVDNGKTTLLSPVLDASGAQQAVISYVRWYSNSAGASPNVDIFEVDVSNDGGQSWVNAETVGPEGAGTGGGWIAHEFNVADFVPLTDQIRVRFIASDYDPQALIEAAVDRFRMNLTVCEDVVPVCPEDLNGSESVDVSDLLILLSNWGACEGTPCDSDLNGDTNVDVSDMLQLLGAWGDC